MSGKKKLLVHTCCAPCLIGPYQHLKDSDWEVTLLWFNPNIHPYTEYLKRRDTLKEYVEKAHIPIIWQDEYDLDLFLSATAEANPVRCAGCYELRLQRTAQIAMGKGFDAFTTTLLYSKYQKHELAKDIGERLARQFGIEFYYQDWRVYWQEGIDLSLEEQLYRQPYCGCIFSEKNRYWKPSKVLT